MIFFKAIAVFFSSNIFSFLRIFDLSSKAYRLLLVISIVYLIFFNIKPTVRKQPAIKNQRIKNGVTLLEAFIILVIADIVWLFFMILGNYIPAKDIIINSVIVSVQLFILFWNGIIRTYIFSEQMGIKWRAIGIICGFIPIANIIVLTKIIKIADLEYKTEVEKLILNNSRKEQEICKTKYPILLVHGVFFRDFRFFNYWGRIPDELKKNGGEIYYGNQQSAASVEECGREIAERIRTIVNESGCEKVNIIAHSKGGLDSRYAISFFGADKYVASLTTVNTPHKGCQFADYLLNIAPEKLKKSVADKYNRILKKLGDNNPDFLSAVQDLTAESCIKRNELCKNSENVYYQSIGSKALKATSSHFPLNLSYHLVKYFDGENDGLVAVDSMNWGESFKLFKPHKNRGISHGDMIDLNRENIDGFDVRETYVEIVSGLKKMGF